MQQTSISDMLIHMYKKQNGNSSDKELIDISSDDDVSKNEPKADKEAKVPNVCNVIDESSHKPLVVTPKTESVTQKPEMPTSKPEPPVSNPEIHALKSETLASKSETPVKSNTVCVFTIEILDLGLMNQKIKYILYLYLFLANISVYN